MTNPSARDGDPRAPVAPSPRPERAGSRRRALSRATSVARRVRRRGRRANARAERAARNAGRGEEEGRKDSGRALGSLRFAPMARVCPTHRGAIEGATRVCAAAVWRSAPAAKPIAERAAIVRATRGDCDTARATPFVRPGTDESVSFRDDAHLSSPIRAHRLDALALKPRFVTPRPRPSRTALSRATPSPARSRVRSPASRLRTRAPPRPASASRARRALGASTCPPSRTRR
jgi:hypothetical protein